ncbi:DUF1772 domain-containing protein [Sphingomonas sp. LB-2]|uniref:DUF1772 domain-containing protein n=1 Tax=Sphingomonas caeni TaxID=2984949 RepID=UPI00222EE789|nr:DUF1772 domain-containing protein [Sphingomonas caeni]MCW3846462.1 DUF1772 domain-containing protein [Sphingomonas caeni]
MLALLALVTAALFTGASFYVSFAEHPARLRLDDRAALTQWKPSYDRGAIMQASLALVSGLAGIGAWYRWMSVWPWLAGGLVMLSIIAWTFAVIWQTNGKLKATLPDAAGPETRALLVKWGQLHLGRTVLSIVATAFFIYGNWPNN